MQLDTFSAQTESTTKVSFVHCGLPRVMDADNFVRYVEEHFPRNSVVEFSTVFGTVTATVLRARWDGTSNLVVVCDRRRVLDVPISSLTLVKKARDGTVAKSASDPRPPPPGPSDPAQTTPEERRALNEFTRPTGAQIATERGRVAAIDKDIKKHSAHLSSPGFCERAPERVVAKAREQLAQMLENRKVVVARLEALKRA